MGRLIEFIRDTRGVTSVEYALIAAGLSMAIVAVVSAVGTSLNAKYAEVATGLN